ncbi:hypothetical protein SEA_KALAH2_64 [Mycobacterium phage Kalah2]|nr:hypothetical protein SEA_KLEIN_69 [Mycobacterium phage Klein]AYB69551.1 hypothetical protein SEA_KALAH2_64 [Mycobacterium phage Kalah2]
MSDIEKMIADILRSMPGGCFGSDADAGAKEIVEKLGLAECTVDWPVPERWWNTAIQELGEDGKWRWRE